VNFLAHLLLDHASPRAMIGSIMPDLVPGKWRHSDDPAIQRAIGRHRRVDLFTDTHVLFARSKARLFAQHGRYSGILVDVFYDHLLSRTWSAYHGEPLAHFIARVHDELGRHTRLMPPPMRPIVARLIEQRWLEAYGDDDGLRRILGMMSWRFSQRFGRLVSLEPAVDDLVLHRPGLAADFAAFFPALAAHMAGDDADMISVSNNGV
jgi:acyl carrier protein phosphodiesterase